MKAGLADLVDLDDGDGADIRVDGSVDRDDDRLPELSFGGDGTFGGSGPGCFGRVRG